MKQKWIPQINDCLYSQKDNKTQTEQQSVQKINQMAERIEIGLIKYCLVKDQLIITKK
jgi:hypothetical protein